MKKTKKPSERQSAKQKGLILLLCVACFGAGVSVPMLIEKAKGIDSQEFSKLETVYSLLKNQWYYGAQIENLEDQLIEQSIVGMSSNEIDPHTNYLGLDQAKDFSDALSGSNVGIGTGFYRDADNNMVVKSVFIDSAADQAGIQEGDVITKVGSKMVSDISNEDLITLIQNHDGQNLDITLMRNGEPKNVHVVPGVYDSTVICREFDGYGEIVLSSFSEHSGQDFKKAVERLQEKGIKKIIIDLRNNTGGYLDAAIQIASSLLPKESIVFKEKTRNGKIEESEVLDSYTPAQFDQIVLLQNENSASASEVLIGALKDNLKDKVTTIGSTSYGKGTKQVLVPFSDGTSLKYTESEWLTPSGESINNKGFAPDVEVEDTAIRQSYYSTQEEDLEFEQDSVNPNAQALQLFLQYLDYPVDRVDSYFSAQSAQALKQFQEDHQLEANGKVDAKTWEVLEQEVSLKMNQKEMEDDVQLQKAIELIKAE
ncbi:S41 family peptidase [Dubosiella newyorkensis]|jgi:carboxyl-terminal processing protease|uniref:S41 family peptidase n=1 Tax=Dubosiella newyorkensis TaxID=1862672 RepID=UPI0023572BF3|nr:S41 family peptidase [Dubosiella newyorkensis]MCI9041875.1 S41 family peptidase [Dubosiella newyorkensis]